VTSEAEHALETMWTRSRLFVPVESPPVENQFFPEIPAFDANPDQTTDWHLAASNRFCEINELLSTQKMLEVIPPNHAVEMSELLGT
jgi:hypothetical protein